MAEQKNEQRQELTPELREKRDAVGKVRKQLDVLQTEVQKLRRPQGKVSDGSQEDREVQGNAALSELFDAWKFAIKKPVGMDNPEWKMLLQAIGPDIKTLDLPGLLQNLEDSPEEGDARSALANLAGDLNDEMRAADTYLETFPKAPPDERLWEAVQKFMDEKLSPDLRKKIEGIGLDAASLRDMIVGFIAGIAEGIPAFAALGGKLRFRVALEQARNGEDKDKVNKAIQDSLIQKKPEALKKLEADWNVLYKQWLQRKCNAKQANLSFDEPTPTIHDVLHPPAQPKAPETPVAAIYGNDKLVRGQRLSLSKIVVLKDGPNEVTIDVSQQKKIIKAPDGKRYSIKIGTKEDIAIALEPEAQAQPAFRDLKIVFDGNPITLREVLDILPTTRKIGTNPEITFEYISS